MTSYTSKLEQLSLTVLGSRLGSFLLTQLNNRDISMCTWFLSSWPNCKCMVQSPFYVHSAHSCGYSASGNSWFHDCMLHVYHPASSNVLRPRQLIVQMYRGFCTIVLHIILALEFHWSNRCTCTSNRHIHRHTMNKLPYTLSCTCAHQGIIIEQMWMCQVIQHGRQHDISVHQCGL